MAYNITISVRRYEYKVWEKAVVWCHQNLCFEKDFAYTDEHVRVGGRYHHWPIYLWLQDEEDLVALKLASGMDKI